MHFSRTITLGNIVSLLTLLVAGIGIFTDVKIELAVLKTQMFDVQNATITASSKIDEANKAIERLSVSTVRLETRLNIPVR